jgi:formamidopyrimidine-DNA glycosylase
MSEVRARVPELPEVETMARELRPYVLGRVIRAFWCDRPAILGEPKDPLSLGADLTGQRIVAVSRRAKIILFCLDDGGLLTYAPRMTGQFVVVPAGSPHEAHERAGLTLSDGLELRIRDARTFGRLNYYPSVSAEVSQEGEGVRYLEAPTGRDIFAALGPEPLDPHTNETVMLRLSARKYANRPIKSALLDQHFLAGVGNIYADEALWATKIHPQRKAGSLSLVETQQLFKVIVRLLEVAVDHRGSTIGNYRSLEGAGHMQQHLAVYGRAGALCVACEETRLVKLKVGGRGTVICPHCQKL